MHHFLKFILFWNNTVRASDCLSVHHQEFNTVHTAKGICETGTATCLLASLGFQLYKTQDCTITKAEHFVVSDTA